MLDDYTLTTGLSGIIMRFHGSCHALSGWLIASMVVQSSVAAEVEDSTSSRSITAISQTSTDVPTTTQIHEEVRTQTFLSVGSLVFPLIFPYSD